MSVIAHLVIHLHSRTSLTGIRRESYRTPLQSQILHLAINGGAKPTRLVAVVLMLLACAVGIGIQAVVKYKWQQGEAHLTSRRWVLGFTFQLAVELLMKQILTPRDARNACKCR